MTAATIAIRCWFTYGLHWCDENVIYRCAVYSNRCDNMIRCQTRSAYTNTHRNVSQPLNDVTILKTHNFGFNLFNLFIVLFCFVLLCLLVQILNTKKTVYQSYIWWKYTVNAHAYTHILHHLGTTYSQKKLFAFCYMYCYSGRKQPSVGLILIQISHFK